jgi:hypothetical protein
VCAVTRERGCAYDEWFDACKHRARVDDDDDDDDDDACSSGGERG